MLDPLAAALALVQTLGAVAEPASPQTDIRVTLDPSARVLEAEALIALPVSNSTSELAFLLHDDLDIINLSGPDVAGHERQYSIEIPGLGVTTVSLVTVEFSRPLEPGETASMAWQYSGWIDTDRIVLGAGAGRPEWVELDIGAAWHPVEASFSSPALFQLEVSAPESYLVLGAGVAESVPGRTSFTILEPAISATVIAAPSGALQMERVTDRVTLAMVPDTLEPAAFADIVGRTAETMEAKLGPVERAGAFTIVLPPADRARDGEAYARSNLIVMASGMEPGPARLRVAAHELAHMWWYHAHPQTEDNFLNEAFAEYYAWLAVEAEYGEQAAAEFRSRASEAARGAGALRGGEPPFPVYTRGPLVLADLHDRLGDENFHAFAREASQRPVRTLDDLIALAAEMAGEEHAQRLEAELARSM